MEFGPMLARPDSFYYTCFKCVPSLDRCVYIKGNARYNIYDNNLGLVLDNYADTTNWTNEAWWSFLNEQMGMGYCQLELGRIIIGDKSVSLEECEQGIGTLGKYSHDIPIASYDIDTSEISWVEITSIDSVNRIVEGKFEFHFLLKQEDEGAGFAKKITYNHGEFRAKNY